MNLKQLAVYLSVKQNGQSEQEEEEEFGAVWSRGCETRWSGGRS